MPAPRRFHPVNAFPGPCRVSGSVLLALVLTACTTPTSTAPSAGVSSMSTRISFYAAGGQNPSQQQRDRYECFLESARAARFDPSAPQLPPPYRFSIVPSRTPITPSARPVENGPAPAGSGLALGERANRYRLLVRQCLMERGYGVR